MGTEWSGFFEYVCSMYSNEIAELLQNTEYKKLCEDFDKYKNRETAEKKATCYYTQASLVALKHYVKLLRETNMI